MAEYPINPKHNVFKKYRKVNYINPYVFGVSYDPDAQAFLTATAITDLTISNAINQLVLDLKSYGLWTKMKAIYPIVGGTAFTHKFNLKDPRDLDAAFRIAYAGSQTHSSTGMISNYQLNTFLVPSSVLSLNSTHLSFYSRSNIAGAQVLMGIAGSPSLYLAPSFNGDAYRSINGNQVGPGTGLNLQAFFIGSRINSTTIKLYRNTTTSFTDAQTSTSLSSSVVSLIGYTPTGSAFPTPNECAFASIGDGLSDTEANNFYTAVQTFQTSLSRQV